VDILTSTPFAPLLGDARRREYPKGQIILYQGDTPSDMYLLKSGEVKIYDIDEQGSEKILHILRPPAMFPFAGYLAVQPEVMWFYGALTDTEVYVLQYADIKSYMKQHGEFTVYLLDRLVGEMHELLVRLNSMGKTTARGKLVAALKFLGVHHSEIRRNNWRRVTFPVSHQLLADMTGITRESATMTMKQLQLEKIIRCPRLTVLEINFPKLVQL
jgi:CRP-like cAMP-binding protein